VARGASSSTLKASLPSVLADHTRCASIMTRRPSVTPAEEADSDDDLGRNAAILGWEQAIESVSGGSYQVVSSTKDRMLKTWLFSGGTVSQSLRNIPPGLPLAASPIQK